MILLPAPLEGVMKPHFVRAANHLELFPAWVTPFYRFSEGMPRRKHLAAFLEPFRASGLPVTVQLMGTDPALLAAGAALFAELGATGIDYNFGCPSRQVIQGGAGGGALRDPENMRRIIAATRSAVGPDFPVSAKIRVGFAAPEELPAIVAALLADGALNMLCCHYRTVREQYRALPPELRLARFRQLMALVDGRLPVVLNGDFTTAAELRELPAALGAAGAMAGRGLLRDPWLLRRALELTAPDVETGRLTFFFAVLDEAGELPTGQAIELSNFIWGSANPFFGALKGRPGKVGRPALAALAGAAQKG